MQTPKDISKKAPAALPPDDKRAQVKPQTGNTANRDSVRQLQRVRAPRQSQRPVVRSK